MQKNQNTEMNRDTLEELLLDILVHGKDRRNELAEISREGDGLCKILCADGTEWNLNITKRAESRMKRI
ncbi:hypothetical protein [Paenibacillus sp. Leaf72]|uniref:hypothetical protein n=1 Tax=Paenibacillus sp. Leaf72 TaxID=1736234 RepID=UPI0006F5AEF0|nr:hypothetical protein [Paenibacillus sp. Leaf72]KQN96867.1 hypothetical protein ASF12_22625 [Paenibacillus sp. Leaf72]